MILIYLLGFIGTCAILYFIVKYAIKNGMKESHKEIEEIKRIDVTSRQLQAKQRYEKGEITFDQYLKEWNDNA